MKTCLTLLLAVCLPFAVPAADQLNPELQRGLFEEEANQNFDAAIKAYQAVLTTHDSERKLAATALFRLGECYRKLGKTNDAVAQYQRLVAEFPDQPTLANLSRQNLTGLGAPKAAEARQGSSGERARFLEQALSGLQLEAAQAASVLKPLQAANPLQRRSIAPTLVPDTVLSRLLVELSAAEQKVVPLESQFSREHPDVRAARNVVQVLNRQIDERVDGIMEGLKFKAEALAQQTAELKKELAELTKSAGPEGGRSATGPNADPVARAQLKELLESEIAIATQFAAEQRKKVESGTLAKGEEVRFERDVLNLKRQLIAADGLASAKERQEWRELLLQEIQLAEEAARLEKQKLESGRTVASEVARLQRDVLILKRELVAFDATPPAAPVTAGEVSAAPSPEAEELARTERLLAQLQGWDLSQLRRLIPTLIPDAQFEQTEKELTACWADLRRLEADSANPPADAAKRDELRKRTSQLMHELNDRAGQIVAQLEKRAATLRDRVSRQPVQSASRSSRAAAGESAAPTDEEEKEIRRIQSLIKDSPDLINAKSVDVGMYGDGRRYGMPLHKAAQQGQLTVARFLIDNHADLNARDGFGRTPLHWAALNGHKSMAELLLSRGAEPNTGVLTGADGRVAGFTPLHFAAQNGYRNVCEALLAGKAELNARTEGNLFTPLHLAAERGFTSVAELLLAKGAEVNARNANGSTPLEIAAGAGMKNTVQLLLTNKADVNLQNAQGGTPLLAAVTANRDDVVRLLLASKANPNLALNEKAGNTAGWTPLSAAVSQEDVPTALLLLENGADPNALFSPSGWTVLMQAATKGGLELAEALVVAGADVNAISGSDARTTALYFVTANNPTNAAAIVELLLKNKADVNVADANGLTPLIHAVTKRNAAVVKLLVENGADVNVLTKNGNSPLSLIKQGRQSGLSVGFGNPVPGSLPPRAYRAADFGGVPGQSQPIPVDPTPEIISLLEQRGARDDLLRLTAVSTTRNHDNRQSWFFKGTNDWNQFTLLELIAWINPRQGINTGLDFPDLSRVVVSRIDSKTAKTEALRVDLSTVLTNSDCAKDLSLQWGDVVNIPELDHFVDARWERFPNTYYETFQKCLERTVRVSIKGQTNTVVLAPFRFDKTILAIRGGPNPWEPRMRSFRLNQFLRGSGLLLTSSDVTRVKVKRSDPATKEIRERVFDLDQPSLRNDETNDLWLRDGDFIEVPEKDSTTPPLPKTGAAIVPGDSSFQSVPARALRPPPAPKQ